MILKKNQKILFVLCVFLFAFGVLLQPNISNAQITCSEDPACDFDSEGNPFCAMSFGTSEYCSCGGSSNNLIIPSCETVYPAVSCGGLMCGYPTTCTCTPASTVVWECDIFLHACTSMYTSNPTIGLFSSEESCEATCGSSNGGSATEPGFAASVDPLSRTINQGNSTTYLVTITPSNGFTGTISLSTDGTCPANATCSFSPSSVTISGSSAVTSTLTISTNSSVALQSYSITIKGTNTGNTSQTTVSNVTLIVQQNPYATCDNTWRNIPWVTFSEYVADAPGEYYSAAQNSSGVYLYTTYPADYSAYGIGMGAMYNKCTFGYGSVCLWDSGAYSINNGTSGFGSNVFASNPTSVYVRRSSDSTAWLWNGSTWSNQGVITPGTGWNTPHSLTDSSGRAWEFRTTGSGSARTAQYRCTGSSACTAPPALNTANSTFSPSTVAVGGSVNIRCDFGSQVDYISPNFTGASACTWNGWASPGSSVATYTCTATEAGSYTVYCNTFNIPSPGSNICATQNAITNPAKLNVGSVSATIRANGNTGSISIPYNTAATISWTSTNASSCSVSPTGWTGVSGSQSSGNLTSSRTYTVSCNSGSAVSSVVVNVQSPVVYGLNVIKSGQGTITGTDITCGADCQGTYVQGTTVVLTEIPNAGRIFTGWSGACSGKSSTCSVLIDGNKTVYANFIVDPNFKEF